MSASEFEYKVINRHLMVTRQSPRHSWRVEANIFEVAKAYCIWDGKPGAKQYLPRFVLHINEDYFPDLYQWRLALSKCSEEDLAAVDFSKPFDTAVADAILSKYRKQPSKPADVDADLIIQGELGELES